MLNSKALSFNNSGLCRVPEIVLCQQLALKGLVLKAMTVFFAIVEAKLAQVL